MYSWVVIVQMLGDIRVSCVQREYVVWICSGTQAFYVFNVNMLFDEAAFPNQIFAFVSLDYKRVFLAGYIGKFYVNSYVCDQLILLIFAANMLLCDCHL